MRGQGRVLFFYGSRSGVWDSRKRVPLKIKIKWNYNGLEFRAGSTTGFLGPKLLSG